MGNQSSSSYDSKSDPCESAMQAYLTCVESHKNGLTEGDDCSDEGIKYKECRKQFNKEKDNKSINGK